MKVDCYIGHNFTIDVLVKNITGLLAEGKKQIVIMSSTFYDDVLTKTIDKERMKQPMYLLVSGVVNWCGGNGIKVRMDRIDNKGMKLYCPKDGREVLFYYNLYGSGLRTKFDAIHFIDIEHRIEIIPLKPLMFHNCGESSHWFIYPYYASFLENSEEYFFDKDVDYNVTYHYYPQRMSPDFETDGCVSICKNCEHRLGRRPSMKMKKWCVESIVSCHHKEYDCDFVCARIARDVDDTSKTRMYVNKNCHYYAEQFMEGLKSK